MYYTYSTQEFINSLNSFSPNLFMLLPFSLKSLFKAPDAILINDEHIGVEILKYSPKDSNNTSPSGTSSVIYLESTSFGPFGE